MIRLAACGLTLAAALLGRADADIIIVNGIEPWLRLDMPGHTGEVSALAFSADGTRLISGGRDKLALVWDLGGGQQAGADAANGPRERDIVVRRARERVIRWPIARADRGWVQAVAASPAGEPPVIAVAGTGFMGSAGDIFLVDASDGSLVEVLREESGPDTGITRPGHRQSVKTLAFTADGSWLVSQDLDGQAFAWRRADGWKPVELAKREEERLGADRARSLRLMPRVRPLAVLGNDRVAIPEVVSGAGEKTPKWRIRIIDLGRPGVAQRVLPPDHFGVVTAMSATPDGRNLVTADFSGQLIALDPVGDRKAEVVELEKAAVAESLAVLPDGKRVVIGVAAGENGASPPRLETWDLFPARRVGTRSVDTSVRALAASRDGKLVAWSGARGRGVTVEPAAGLVRAEADVQPGERLSFGGVGQQITRVAFSTRAADARRAVPPPAADAGGGGADPRNRNIVIMRRQPPADPAAAPPPRRIAVCRGRRVIGQPPPPFDGAFDIEGLATGQAGPEEEWAPAEGRPAGWALRADLRPEAQRRVGEQRWTLVRDDGAGGKREAGVIDLVDEWQGIAGAAGTAVSWITRGDEKEPWAVAIGTDFGVFVYRIEQAAGVPCRLVRWFRGNENRLLSLAVSEDGRWLASGGGDGIAMIWSLSGIDAGEPLTDRWGASIRVDNGRAMVERVEEAGPLAGKDVRAGDVIARISFAEGRTSGRTEHAAGDAIRKSLAEMPWNSLVFFTVERNGVPRVFQRLPAWENIAAVHLARDEEWAFWSPRGYYAASANGDRMFGWLVNHGPERLPSFFRANQFRRRLERPDVVSRLLVAGSLDAALRAAARDVPEAAATVLPDQIATAPTVTILATKQLDGERADKVVVTAAVEVPPAARLDEVRAFVSGVPAALPPKQSVEKVAGADGAPRRVVFEWELDLPEQDRHLVQVLAGVKEGATHAAERAFTAVGPPPGAAPRLRRLHVVATGVGSYLNNARWGATEKKWFEEGSSAKHTPKSWDLDFAVADARAVQDALERRSLGVYTTGSAMVLADQDATLDGWRRSVSNFVNRVKDKVTKDDMVVIFLAGHGLLGDGGDYSYLCHDADLAFEEKVERSANGTLSYTLRPKAEANTLAWADLASLASLPCRKLVMVDTCHSGALAGNAVAIRDFQENSFVVMAAAQDDQPSMEWRDWGHGAFTKAVLEGLGDGGAARKADVRGKAGAPDGIVTLDELADYVIERVPALTRPFVESGALVKEQMPKLSPDALLDYVRPPLVKVAGE